MEKLETGWFLEAFVNKIAMLRSDWKPEEDEDDGKPEAIAKKERNELH